MFKVVDLFAGPGGLAEGFSAVRDACGRRLFEIALSVEMNPAAFRTLRLRSFIRQFDRDIPDEYYAYLAEEIGHAQLIAAHPGEWERACEETLLLELGTEGSSSKVDPLLDAIREEAGENLILVGGPPCQAYSLVGRARNRGILGYEAHKDKRHFLYEEYIRILERLRPAAFVMENVKGFLSARVEGERIFSKVIEDLKGACSDIGGYEIVPLVTGDRRNGLEYLLEAERHGVPQARHRVILLGIRKDLHDGLAGLPLSGLGLDVADPVHLSAVLEDMPRIRSMLSRRQDNAAEWKEAVRQAFIVAAKAAYDEEDEVLDEVADRLASLGDRFMEEPDLAPASSDLGSVCNNALASWLIDPAMRALPNHEARSHMESDLARYAFAATFAEVARRSPKVTDFPKALAPDHKNWGSGKFNDRFRVQVWNAPSTTITSHIAKDGHYFIHPDPLQCRSLTVREAARLQTFPDNYKFEGNRTEQFTQVGNAVPPLLASQIACVVARALRVKENSVKPRMALAG